MREFTPDDLARRVVAVELASVLSALRRPTWWIVDQRDCVAIGDLRGATQITQPLAYLNLETRSACSRMTRALSLASVPVGSPS
jgi:hypothetical protein